MNLLEQQTLLQEGGFSQKEITGWKQDKIKNLQKGGFTNQEISNEFKFQPDTKVIKDYVGNVAKDYLSGRGITMDSVKTSLGSVITPAIADAAAVDGLHK